MRNSYWLLGILIIGFLLRIVSLNQSLWLDEAISIQAVKNFSYLDIISKFSPGDLHPPLYYLMLKMWSNVFGTTEIAIRLLSVTFGVSTMYFLYRIGEKLFNKYIGITCLILLTFSPLHIYYSQEARMYVPAAFFSIAAVWFFVNLITSDKQKLLDKFLFVISAVMLVYTNYIASFTLLFLATSLILEKKSWYKNSKNWIFVWVVIAILSLPLILLILEQIENIADARKNTPLWWTLLGKTSAKEVLLVPAKFMLGRISFADKQLYTAVVVVSTVIFSLPFLLALKVWKKNKFVWLWFLIPLSLALLQGVLFSGFSYFRLIFLLPAFYLLLSIGLFSVKQRKLRLITGVGIVIISLLASSYYLINPRFHREDWRAAVAYVENNSDVNAVSIFVTNNQRDAYNYYGKTVSAFGPQRLDEPLPGKIWLFRYVQPIFDPQDNVRVKIESIGYIRQDELDFNGVTVWEYQREGTVIVKQ